MKMTLDMELKDFIQKLAKFNIKETGILEIQLNPYNKLNFNRQIYHSLNYVQFA